MRTHTLEREAQCDTALAKAQDLLMERRGTRGIDAKFQRTTPMIPGLGL